MNTLGAMSLDFGWAQQSIERGGPIVVVLALLSVAALAVALMKAAQFTSQGVGGGRGVAGALDAWARGDRQAAVAQLEGRRSPTTRVLRHAMTALAARVPESIVREDGERVALEALSHLRSHLRVLEATSQLAPLLGLFGTVVGMMSAFQALQSAGSDADPAALAGGIWVALITTAVGLVVAIPASFVLYWFEGRIERERILIETSLTRVLTSSHTVARVTGGSAPVALRALDAGHAAE